MDEFVIHGCEQVLRFTQVARWEDLTEERRVQLAFNMGVVSLGLKLTKEEGYLPLVEVREGRMTMPMFRKHLQGLIVSRQVKVDEAKIARPF